MESDFIVKSKTTKSDLVPRNIIESDILKVFSLLFIVTCIFTILYIVKFGNRIKLSYLSTYFFPNLSWEVSHVKIVRKKSQNYRVIQNHEQGLEIGKV